MTTFVNKNEAYIGVLKDIWFNYDFICSPRGLKIREKVDYKFTVMHPTCEPIKTYDEERNKVIADYTQKETDLYNLCTNKVDDFAEASKFWKKIANPDGTINSAYGYLIWKNRSFGNPHYEYNDGVPTDGSCGMRTPWEWAKESLIRDKDTRQAFIKFSLPEHHWFGNKDQTCTMHGNFLIRQDKLYFTVVMRSNDMVLGLAYDLPWFISLMDKMLEDIRPTYPTLEKGSYTHIAHSLHIYERDESKVLKMLGITSDTASLT